MARGRGAGVNYVAWLAALAATSFALPLLVQAGEALGLGRGASAVVSLVLAACAVGGWLVRARLRVLRRPERAGARRVPARRRPAARPGGHGSLVDGGTLRLVEAEEESRAGV